jgi:hypothetical protein
MVRVSLPQESLSKVNFGAPAAERDIEGGLDEYFVESEAYSRVKAGAKRILRRQRDRKGALFRSRLPGGAAAVT